MGQKKTNMILVLIFLTSILVSNVTASDVLGTVKDSMTGFPLSNVVVKIIETGDSTMTDINGVYFIPNVLDGPYTLLVGSVNYTPLIFARTIGSCCIGLRGNINGDPADQIDISDLVYLVSFMFQNGANLLCIEEGDVDASGGETPIDISDLVYLVSYMFQGGITPQPCL